MPASIYPCNPKPLVPNHLSTLAEQDAASFWLYRCKIAPDLSTLVKQTRLETTVRYWRRLKTTGHDSTLLNTTRRSISIFHPLYKERSPLWNGQNTTSPQRHRGHKGAQRTAFFVSTPDSKTPYSRLPLDCGMRIGDPAFQCISGDFDFQCFSITRHPKSIFHPLYM